MIQIQNVEINGWDAAIRGMRNPMNSWDKSDSCFRVINDDGYPGYWYQIGENDLLLMRKLVKAGPDHAKFLRMVTVTADVTAPLYWWKEYDTYKVGTVANSCSTMHKIHGKVFELDDFSHEKLCPEALECLENTIDVLNAYRDAYVAWDDVIGDTPVIVDPAIQSKKDIWWQMIQLLPSSYNQKRTIHLNYQVLQSMYFARRAHKLDEWRGFCDWCRKMPYFDELFIHEDLE